jgi:hypothetical protein
VSALAGARFKFSSAKLIKKNEIKAISTLFNIKEVENAQIL